jgi:hypothetical protein
MPMAPLPLNGDSDHHIAIEKPQLVTIGNRQWLSPLEPMAIAVCSIKMYRHWAHGSPMAPLFVR